MFIGTCSTPLTHIPGFWWCLLPHAFGAGRLNHETWMAVCVTAHFWFVSHTETNPEWKQFPAEARLTAGPEHSSWRARNKTLLVVQTSLYLGKDRSCCAANCSIQTEQSSWFLSRKDLNNVLSAECLKTFPVRSLSWHNSRCETLRNHHLQV